jgi:hypothetical protein
MAYSAQASLYARAAVLRAESISSPVVVKPVSWVIGWQPRVNQILVSALAALAQAEPVH